MSTDQPALPPTRVKLQLAGFGGRACQLEWEDGQLWHRECPLGAGGLHRIPWEAHSAPTEAAWRRLRGALDAVDFWRWPAAPADSGEAFRWRLSLRWNGHSRTAAGMHEPQPALGPLLEAVLALRGRPSADFPKAFHLRCDWPGGEEHFGWDGRHLAFAAYQPRPRIHEGQPVPAEAWKAIAPLLEAGRPVRERVPAEAECFLIEPLFEDSPLPAREVPAPLRHELRQRLKGLLPAHCRLDGVPGTGLAARI